MKNEEELKYLKRNTDEEEIRSEEMKKKTNRIKDEKNKRTKERGIQKGAERKD